jgi:3-deoxy-D-manno-octulosonic-acid transferase
VAFFYQIFIHLFNFSTHFASLFNKKAKAFVKGRKDLFPDLKTRVSWAPISGSQLVWFHCASLGEFEQARPLIEKYKVQPFDPAQGDKPKYKVLITFFSPSGFEIRKKYEGADFVFYLPVDTQSNARKFIDIVNPSLVFFVKYDLWYNYLHELRKRKIPTYLVSANFRQEQFKGLYGGYLRKVLGFFTIIFVQNEASKSILTAQKIPQVTVSGDLRYDKVSETVLQRKKISTVEHFKGESKILIGGSTWEKDEEIISGYKFQVSGYKLIIAPHEINDQHIMKILSLFPHALRYSEINSEAVSTALDKLNAAKVLIIDNIGMLSNLYQYADIAYIGGGFGAGIHNILEAAAFGVPVIFGPNYDKFPEAGELIEQGGGFSIENANDFRKVMELFLSDQKILKMASMTCRNFVSQRKGATEKIMVAL